MGGRERAEFNEILILEKAARGTERGDDEKIVADVRIGDTVNLTRVLERNDDSGARGAGNAARERERT